jgi:hypothetical protein
METIRFTGRIRYWNPEKASGLAVADIPDEHVQALGGLKQQRVRGILGGAEFTSNVMPARRRAARVERQQGDDAGRQRGHRRRDGHRDHRGRPR